MTHYKYVYYKDFFAYQEGHRFFSFILCVPQTEQTLKATYLKRNKRELANKEKKTSWIK